MLLAAASNPSSDVGYIQTINDEGTAVASIAFTNLDTASYHRWRLTCHDLYPSNATTVGIQVGEGTGTNPTWETASTYYINEADNAGGSIANAAGATFGAILIGAGNWIPNGPGNFVTTIGDLATTTGGKLFSFTGAYDKASTGPGAVWGMGNWNGDNNAITALRVIGLGGSNIRGSCTLEGFVQ